MFEYLIGLKYSVFLAAVIGGLFRIRLTESKLTGWRWYADKLAVVVLSVAFALLLLQPVMVFFGLPIVLENLMAMVLALIGEMLVQKFFTTAKTFNLKKYLLEQLKDK